MSESRVPWLFIVLPTLVLLAGFVAPNVLLLTASAFKSEAQVLTHQLTTENYQFIFFRPLYRLAIFRTFWIGASVGALVVLLSYPVAFFLTRTASRWRGVLTALILAPLLASVIVRTYGWWVLLNREGALNGLLLGLHLVGEPQVMLPSSGAIIVGLTHALLPYGVLTIMGALAGLNPNVERAAMSLGASQSQDFPGSDAAAVADRDRGGLFAGLFAGDQRVRDAGDPGRPGDGDARDADLQIHGLAGGLVDRVGAGRGADREFAGAAVAWDGARDPADGMRPWALLRWVVGAVYVFALGPILITATVSFNAADQSRFPPVGFSLRWWQAALVPRWLGPLGFSVELALGAAVLAVLLGFPLAYGLTRYRFPGRDLLAALSLGPLALPAMVTGIGLLQLLQLSGLGVMFGLPALLLGHLIICLPFAVRTIGVSLQSIPRNAELAALSLGAPRFTHVSRGHVAAGEDGGVRGRQFCVRAVVY